MINTPVSEIKGIGESRSKLLLKLGIKTVNDMLYFVPRQMEDRSEISQIKDLRSGEHAAICAELISGIEEMRIRKNLVIYKAIASDGTGAENYAVAYANLRRKICRNDKRVYR